MSLTDLLGRYDWPVEEALTIVNCESSGNPDAINNNPETGDMSVGLFQINIFGELAKERPSKEWLIDPKNNTDFAYSIYKKNGWRDWQHCSKLLETKNPSNK